MKSPRNRLTRLAAVYTAAAIVAAKLVCLQAAGADGSELFAIGAVQTGSGGAGVASPQDATWALLNPAGLVDLDRRLDVSVALLHNRLWSSPRGWPAAANPWAGDMRIENLVPVPSGGIVWPVGRGTLGFGVFGLQGNLADFPRPRTTISLLDNADRRSRYESARIPLAYGYRFENGWAVGAAVAGAFTRFRLDSATLALRPTRGDHGTDIALGAGMVVGIYNRWEQWSIGAAYSSRVWMGDYRGYKSDIVHWNFDLPQKLQAGLAYRPADRLEIVLDYKWIDWSATKLLGNTTIRGGLGWQDQHIFKGGVAWEVTDRWTVRGGASWSEAPIKDRFAFANGLTPALGELHVALGFSYRLSAQSVIHAAAAFAPRRERTDTGQGDIISYLGRGSMIGYQENALVVQYTREF